MKRSIVFVALALLICGCNKKVDASPPPAPSADAIDPRDYAVYSAILDDSFAGSSLFVINLMTIAENGLGSSDDSGQQMKYLRERLKLLTDELYADFRRHNDQSYRLERKLSVKAEYKLVTEKELKAAFTPAPGDESDDLDFGWKSFHRTFPGARGIIGFSRVGYSADGKTAMLYVSYSCGGLCGQGNDLILVLENGEWKIKESVMMWIS